jgi:hypothetical protein
VWSLDFDNESISDESINKKNDCSTRDGANSAKGGDTFSQASTADGVSFAKNSVAISKSENSKKSLITHMFKKERSSRRVDEEASIGKYVSVQHRGRKHEREEISMSRSQSI